MQQLSPALDILVVDDDRELALEFKEHLAEAGWRVETAYSAQEALLMTSDFRPRLIIADIKMPGMNGIEMSQIIGRFADAPCVILMSGCASSILVANNVFTGAFAILEKPVPLHILDHFIKQKLSHPGSATRAEGSR